MNYLSHYRRAKRTHADKGEFTVSGFIITVAVVLALVFAGIYIVDKNIKFDDDSCQYTLFGVKVYEKESCKPSDAPSKDPNRANDNYGQTLDERKAEGAIPDEEDEESFGRRLDNSGH